VEIRGRVAVAIADIDRGGGEHTARLVEDLGAQARFIATGVEPVVRGGIRLEPGHVAAAVIALVEDESAAGETVMVRDAPPA
jgi:hypothetical protein